jgi:endoglucanase
MLSNKRLLLLREILEQPAAPFREHHVAQCVSKHLYQANVPHFYDLIGNLVIGVGSKAEYNQLLRKKNKEPVRVFIAHMDHPGFHGTRWLNKNSLAIKWHGGSPVKHLTGSKVWLADDKGPVAEGRLTNVTLLKSKLAIDTAVVRFKSEADSVAGIKPKELFGSFSFRSHSWLSGKRLYTRAADDLVGVFCIVAIAMDLFRRQQKNKSFIGLLTRAEEVGFVGAVKHLELGWLQKATRPVVCVSLEASRHLPGARIGKGPVVRLGDRRTPFDSSTLQVLSELAVKTLPGRHQRRLMDGGACEATATTAWGLPTVGITLPLGNYHNQGLDGGMDCPKPSGPAPEFVHLDDVSDELKLCKALMKNGLNWSDPWSPLRVRLGKISRKYNKLL